MSNTDIYVLRLNVTILAIGTCAFQVNALRCLKS